DWHAHLAHADKPTLIFSEIVCIHTPAGQLAWGLPMDRAALFDHLVHEESCEWDGHTPAERDARLRELLRMPLGEGPADEPPPPQMAKNTRRALRRKRKSV